MTLESTPGSTPSTTKMAVPLVDFYLDAGWQPPPPIVFSPSSAASNLSIVIYRVSSPFDFYGNLFTQYLYIPFASTTTSLPSANLILFKTIVLTIGVSPSNAQALDATPLYYNTFSLYPNKAAMPTYGVRTSNLVAGTSASPAGMNYVSGPGIADYLTGNGQETIVNLKNSAGSIIASYVWRKIDSTYSSDSCPSGTAGGPEDLFLQQSIF